MTERKRALSSIELLGRELTIKPHVSARIFERQKGKIVREIPAQHTSYSSGSRDRIILFFFYQVSPELHANDIGTSRELNIIQGNSQFCDQSSN